MCDYSLAAMKSRPAKVGDKITTHNFGTGTRGFRATDDVPTTNPGAATAVCVLPGTKMVFEKPVAFYVEEGEVVQTKHKVALFHKLDKENPQTHHDLIDLPDGTQVYLTKLVEGQHAHLVELPAVPKTPGEREAQRRAAYV